MSPGEPSSRLTPSAGRASKRAGLGPEGAHEKFPSGNSTAADGDASTANGAAASPGSGSSLPGTTTTTPVPSAAPAALENPSRTGSDGSASPAHPMSTPAPPGSCPGSLADWGPSAV
jgi:pyruvate/2-oxoglutarate dehydrogenase complex dihydrolipoamide acyltransferase (E2) component